MRWENWEHDSIADTRKDGGGIRGLSELVIIEELMERLKWTENLDEVPIPADFFDCELFSNSPSPFPSCFRGRRPSPSFETCPLTLEPS